MLFRRAVEADAAETVTVVLDRLRWLQSRGLDQWSTRDQAAVVRGSIAERSTWVLQGDDGQIVGTLAIYPEPPIGLWTDAELSTPAVYIAKLASVHGQPGVGRLLIDCAAAVARDRGIGLLRWDAWSTNPDLHRYYCSIPGVRMLRVVPGQLSGALFELQVSDARELPASLRVEA